MCETLDFQRPGMSSDFFGQDRSRSKGEALSPSVKLGLANLSHFWGYCACVGAISYNTVLRNFSALVFCVCLTRTPVFTLCFWCVSFCLGLMSDQGVEHNHERQSLEGEWCVLDNSNSLSMLLEVVPGMILLQNGKVLSELGTRFLSGAPAARSSIFNGQPPGAGQSAFSRVCSKGARNTCWNRLWRTVLCGYGWTEVGTLCGRGSARSESFRRSMSPLWMHNAQLGRRRTFQRCMPI